MYHAECGLAPFIRTAKRFKAIACTIRKTSDAATCRLLRKSHVVDSTRSFLRLASRSCRFLGLAVPFLFPNVRSAAGWLRQRDSISPVSVNQALGPFSWERLLS